MFSGRQSLQFCLSYIIQSFNKEKGYNILITTTLLLRLIYFERYCLENNLLKLSPRNAKGVAWMRFMDVFRTNWLMSEFISSLDCRRIHKLPTWRCHYTHVRLVRWQTVPPSNVGYVFCTGSVKLDEKHNDDGSLFRAAMRSLKHLEDVWLNAFVHTVWNKFRAEKKSQFLLLSALLTVHYHDKHKTFFFIKELVTNPVMPLQQWLLMQFYCTAESNTAHFPLFSMVTFQFSLPTCPVTHYNYPHHLTLVFSISSTALCLALLSHHISCHQRYWWFAIRSFWIDRKYSHYIKYNWSNVIKNNTKYMHCHP